MRKRERNCQMGEGCNKKHLNESSGCKHGNEATNENGRGLGRGFKKRNNQNLVEKTSELSDKVALLKQKEHLEKRLEMINSQLENKVSYIEEVN